MMDQMNTDLLHATLREILSRLDSIEARLVKPDGAPAPATADAPSAPVPDSDPRSPHYAPRIGPPAALRPENLYAQRVVPPPAPSPASPTATGFDSAAKGPGATGPQRSI